MIKGGPSTKFLEVFEMNSCGCNWGNLQILGTSAFSETGYNCINPKE